MDAATPDQPVNHHITPKDKHSRDVVLLYLRRFRLVRGMNPSRDGQADHRGPRQPGSQPGNAVEWPVGLSGLRLRERPDHGPYPFFPLRILAGQRRCRSDPGPHLLQTGDGVKPETTDPVRRVLRPDTISWYVVSRISPCVDTGHGPPAPGPRHQVLDSTHR